MAAQRFEKELKATRQKKSALVGKMPPRLRGPCNHCGHKAHHENACLSKHPQLRERWERTKRGKKIMTRKARVAEKTETPHVTVGLAYIPMLLT